MKIFSKPQQATLTSEYPIDQVLATQQITVAVGSAASAETDYTFTATSYDNCNWIGRFSIDGGVTWVTMDGIVTVSGGYVAVSGNMNGSTNTFKVSVHNTGSGGYTVVAQITLIAKDNQFPYTPAAGYSNVKQPIFDSRINYMKIAKQGYETVNVPANSYILVTIPHNLGYVPYSLLQLSDGYSMFNLTSAIETVGLLTVPIFGYAYADTSNIYVELGGNNNAWLVYLHYKVYYDN